MVQLTSFALACLFATGGWVLIYGLGAKRAPGGIRRFLNEAGLATVSIPTLFLLAVCASVLAGSMIWMLLPIPALLPLAVLLSVCLPIVGLSGSRQKRRVRAEAAWGDVIDSLRMSLRSGSNLSEGMSECLNHIPHDWREVWSRASMALVRGEETVKVLRNFQNEIADPVADRVVESLLIARDTGGSALPVVLRELAVAVRAESSFRREARSRQSWVRNAAKLGVLAPWLVLAMLSSRPENREAYSSQAGTILILGCSVATALAYAFMSKLAKLREAPRWLVGATRG